MITVSQLLEKIKSVDVESISRGSIEETKQDIVVKQQDQLYHGLDSTGSKIQRKYRSNKYARVKNEMNPLPGLGTPDLIVTGAFYRGIQIKVNADSYDTDSTDDKSEDLQKKYGEEIFGLDKENKAAYVNEKLRPVFVGKIREKTGL